MQLTGDVSRDADAGCAGAGVGHRPGDVRSPIINGRRGSREGSAGRTSLIIGVPERQILNEAGERHGDSANSTSECNSEGIRKELCKDSGKRGV